MISGLWIVVFFVSRFYSPPLLISHSFSLVIGPSEVIFMYLSSLCHLELALHNVGNLS